MKWTYLFYILFILLLLTSCSEKDIVTCNLECDNSTEEGQSCVLSDISTDNQIEIDLSEYTNYLDELEKELENIKEDLEDLDDDLDDLDDDVDDLEDYTPTTASTTTVSTVFSLPEDSSEIIFVECTGDAATDTTAIQAAIDNSNGKVILSGSDYTNGGYVHNDFCAIDNTLIIAARKGLIIEGTSLQRTILEWQGKSNTPMFKVEASRDIHFEHLWIRVNTNNELISAIDYYNLCYNERCPSNWVGSSHGNVMEDLYIDGSNGILTYGVRTLLPLEYKAEFGDDCAKGGDCHNEQFLYERVEVKRYRESAFLIEGRNAKLHTFVACNCGASGDPDIDNYGKSCISTVSLTDDPRASGAFYWYGGSANGNQDANFVLGYPNDAILISGLYSERSRMLLRTEDLIDNSRFPLTLDSIRFASGYVHSWDHTKDYANPEGLIVDFRYPGPLIIRGSSLGNTGQYFAEDLSICWRAPQSTQTLKGSFIFEANGIVSGMDNPFAPYDDCHYPTTQTDNLIHRGGNPNNYYETMHTPHTELDVSSSNTFKVSWHSSSYNYYDLSGTGTLRRLERADEGQIVTLIALEGSQVTVEDITQSSSIYANIYLSGSQNYIMEKGDVLTLIAAEVDDEGSPTWYEISRSDK